MEPVIKEEIDDGKMSDRSSSEDPSRSVVQLYDHVKSREFLEQLSLECIEDVRQKPAYLSLKQMMENLISKTVGDSSATPLTNVDRISWMRSQVAECGMLAYTIDSVIAEVVSNKLRHEYNTLVHSIVQEILLKKASANEECQTVSEYADEEKNIPSENLTNSSQKSTSLTAKSVSTIENPQKSPKPKAKPVIKSSTPISSNSSKKVPEKLSHKSTQKSLSHKKTSSEKGSSSMNKKAESKASEAKHPPQRISSRKKFKSYKSIAAEEARSKEEARSIIKDVEAITRGIEMAEKYEKPVNGASKEDQAKERKGASENSTNNERKDDKKKEPVKTKEEIKSKTASTVDTKSFQSDKPSKVSLNKQKPDKDNQDSDGDDFDESSVSSVHTSELSSFDDTISLPSDSEYEEKKISLKDANNMFLRSKLREMHENRKKALAGKLQTKQDSIKDEHSSNEENTPRKIFPQRKRKLNSRYSSDTIYCGLKIYNAETKNDRVSTSAEKDEPKDTSPAATTNPSPSKETTSVENLSSKDDLKYPMHLKKHEEVAVKCLESSQKEISNGFREPVNNHCTSESEVKTRKRGRPRKDEELNVHSTSPAEAKVVHDDSNTSPSKATRRDSTSPPKSNPEGSPNRKRYESEDLYKPKPNFGNRLNKVVTLCSTKFNRQNKSQEK